jgi:hypothetical protein
MDKKITLIDIDSLDKKESSEWGKLALVAVESCPKVKKQREKEILFERFGIGKKPKTLNAIGLKHGVTRERIRQIVNNTIKKIQKNCISEEIQKKISLVENFISQSGGFVTNEALYRKFANGDKNEENAIRFITSLSKNLELLKESNNLREGWHQKSLKQLKIREIVKKTHELLKKAGKVVKIETITDSLNEDKMLIEASLSASKDIMKTDKGHWGLTVWPNVNPRSIRDKSRYILERHGEPIHYTELTIRISEMSNKLVTRQSVHNELIKNQDFVLVGRGIYALREWGYTPGVVEDVIVQVLIEASNPLHKSEIVKRVLEKRIVKESTIILNLQKDRFKRVGKATYTIN